MIVLTLFLAPKQVLAFDSFGFYCAPYTKPFEDAKHYLPTDSTSTTTGQCLFSIPSSLPSASQIAVAVYKGTPGNASFLFGQTISSFYDFNTPYVFNGAGFTTYDLQNNPIYPKQDDDFFAVVYATDKWDANAGSPTNDASSDDYKTIAWKWGAKPQSEWDPVIIIPGILGSWEKDGQWVLDPMAHVYDNLIDTLKVNGYVENKTLFAFPYDWEQSNVTIAQQLAQKIADVKSGCGCSKVDLVAHSMGGLVATQYIESSDYKNDVDQFFMLGTPLAGAPKAYKAWEAGQMELADPTINAFLQRIFDRESKDNGYSNIFDYIHQKPVPSIQELLPIFQNYLKLGSAFLQFPTGYPANPFLQNLIGDPSVYFDKVAKNVQTYVVVGDTGAASTTVGYAIKNSTKLPLWPNGEVVSNINGEGDGTVPFDSAVILSGPEKELKGVEHMNLPTGSEEYILTQLTGAEPASLVNTKYDFKDADWSLAASKIAPSAGDFNILIQTLKDAFLSDIAGHTLLFLMLFSPVDVKITAPDGTQVGKDFSTGATIDQIPNAVYSGPIGEHEYVLIEDPLPGQYKVETIGTGNGAYTVAAGRIDSSTTTSSYVSGTTTLNQIVSNTLFFSSTSTTVVLTPPLPPAATSTSSTTTAMTPDTCVADIATAYKAKWITKKAVFDGLTFDCKALVPLLKTKATLEKIAKPKPAEKLLLAATIAAIKLDLAGMDLLAKDKGNTNDAVSLIIKITTWFRNHELD